MALVNTKGEEIADAGVAGLRLLPDAKLEDIAAQLPELALIEIEFPKFRDGRGFTLARALRERYGYKGDLRAVGHFLPDQFGAMVACGFTSFVTPPEHAPAQYAAALLAHRQPGQLLRRSLSRAREG
ncbi:MAG TPA: DUF934 domain-containing protein [Acidocella sp.]|nr:DUF934 domain-containing protein [Acidocella sp.]